MQTFDLHATLGKEPNLAEAVSAPNIKTLN